ncbi:hypothetical protein H6G26_28240 [Nostoc sp. FACHB-888]|nr:hypothetical protein [Nostoc sp. FACHB-888]
MDSGDCPVVMQRKLQHNVSAIFNAFPIAMAYRPFRWRSLTLPIGP